MLDAVVRYLHDSRVAFRLSSFPMTEPFPEVALTLLPGARLVEACVISVAGAPAIACWLRGESPSYAALALAAHAEVLDGSTADLADEFRGAPEPIPPLGGLLGVPMFVDERVTLAVLVAFRAFAHGDLVQLSYDDLALIERPRVAAFASAGELPETTAPPMH
jgi:hypothetical protein